MSRAINAKTLSTICWTTLLAGLVATVGFTALPGSAQAAETTDRWGVGLEFGVMKLTEGYWDYSNVDQFAGLTLTRGLSKNWNLQGSFFYGYTRPGAESKTEDVGWDFKTGAPLYTMMLQPALKLRYRMAPDSAICPWAGFGVGLTNWKVLNKEGEDVDWLPTGDAEMGWDKNGNQAEMKGNEFTAILELGLDWFVKENLAVNLGARYNLMSGNEVDNVGMSTYWGPDYVDANTGLVQGFLGLTWWFGDSDKDGDGIENRLDACPEEPEDFDGYQDSDGCPDLDNDGDRIPDDVDACPNSAEDYDGFEDEDGCPEPDNDGDGVIDAQDNCPEEAEDVDGYMDDDGCPDPDNDGDGILDDMDQCPDTPAGVEVDENGCPVAEEIKENLVLEGVSFGSGSAQLTPESIGVLARVAESLRAWPEVRIEVRGHTDSSGPAEGNRDLSHRRALSVRDSLIQMGISPSRITAIGYGEDFPIADNSTAAGRAKNRRVELHRVQ